MTDEPAEEAVAVNASHITIEKEKLLIVEGKDEVNFFSAMLLSMGRADVQIIDGGGKQRFKFKLPTIMITPGFEKVTSYGVVQDADTDFAATLASIRAILKNNSQPEPTHGRFAGVPGKRVGIFVMPGENKTGMLETLCFDAVEHYPHFPCVNEYINCVNQNAGGSGPKNIHKAIFRSFLAGLEDDVQSVGVAAQKGVFDFNKCHFDELRLFLHLL